MFVIRLKTNGTIEVHIRTHIHDAIDFSIEHYKEFLSMSDGYLNTLYNRIDADGLGGYRLILDCERLGKIKN
ncbi:MAG: hypothetical protein J6B16_03445 [Clostridia bacterium]|nr:hypothetical protein [Romboutsia sp.]MBO5285933.1 hypothetical protein [Clostridia bacterium]